MKLRRLFIVDKRRIIIVIVALRKILLIQFKLAFRVKFFYEKNT